MDLRCLLVTSDPKLMEVVSTGFRMAGLGLELRTDAASAIELSVRRHLDGFVIDYDDVPGAKDVLANLRSSGANMTSVVFAVVNATTTVGTAVEAGANFVLGKPVKDDALRRYLEVAIPKMIREHRRYSRYKVDVPVQLLDYEGETLAGKMINVSEGGLALVRFGPTLLEGVVTVQFKLPSADPQIFQAKAEIAWNDAYAMGLRFLHIEPSCRPFFETWLSLLEEQLYSREAAQSQSCAFLRCP
jgi:CheY-like chemotaxis protein